MATSQLMSEMFDKPQQKIESIVPTQVMRDESIKIRSAVFNGKKDVQLKMLGKPMITHPTDAIIKVTAASICGSDLHFYNDVFPGIEKGQVLGHETMGIVEQIGSEVKSIKPGDRVVISCVIACGFCDYCKKEEYSFCDNTNNSERMAKMFGGQKICGAFGYSQMTGGYDGGQAEYIRVPIADVNTLKLPSHVPDEKALFLSDVLCTAWHACELGNVHEGDTVAVWGCGPIGLVTCMWAKYRGAKHIIAIDDIQYRLDIAFKNIGVDVIDISKEKAHQALIKKYPNGLDVCIDAVGFRYTKSMKHKIEMKLWMETDCCQVAEEAILSCRKGGTVVLIGDYVGYTNHYPIGQAMEKGIKVVGSQVWVQKYWKKLLGIIEKGEVDFSWLVTHRANLDQVSEAYKMFDEKQDNMIKIVLRP